jgi:hypothetical protein
MEMKAKKFNFDWRNVVLGAVLCLVLVVFVGSRPAQTEQLNAQAEQLAARTRIAQGAANMNDVLAKCELIDQRILIVEGKINRLQEDMNRVLNEIGNALRQGNKK